MAFATPYSTLHHRVHPLGADSTLLQHTTGSTQ